MTSRSLSIGSKLLLAMMTTSLVGLAIVSLALLLHQYGRAREELTGEMARVADIVAANNLGALQFGDRTAASASLGRLAVDDRVVGAAVYDAESSLFAAYAGPQAAAWPGRITSQDVPEGTLEVSRPMVLDGEQVGTLVLRVDPSTIARRFRADVTYLLPLMLVAATIAFVIALVLRRVIASPLLHLAAQAQIVSQQADYSLRVQKRADDEVGTLYERFNEMLSQIERRDLELVTAREVLEARVEERTQALSRARDNAEAASRAKSAFLANMSHELRTPLNAIIGYSELLLEDASLEQTDAGPDLRRIRSSGKHLLQLINDVLDLSKVEAGKMEVHWEAVLVRPFVDELVATVAPQAAKNGNTLVVRCADEVRSLRTDAVKLRQVLLNLLANACKFTHHGTVTLAVSYQPGGPDPWVRFAVEDTGIGISEADLSRLFQPFAQADSATTKKYGGTGLGLALTRRFCDLLGAELRVDSTPGTGSTFIVTVPVKSDDADATTAQRATAPSVETRGNVPPSRPRLLVVDDDAVARDLLIRQAGGEAIEARGATGAEALALARAWQPSVITLDVLMPDPDGWTVLRSLRTDPATLHIPVIMVTQLDARSQAQELGAQEYLTKPVEPVALRAALGRCLTTVARTALVVDRNDDTRALAAGVARNLGWSVVEARSDVDAHHALAAAQPDVVALDVSTMKAHDFQFVVELQSRPEWRAVQLVAVANSLLPEGDRARLDALGVPICARNGRPASEFVKHLHGVFACAASEQRRASPASVSVGAPTSALGPAA